MGSPARKSSLSPSQGPVNISAGCYKRKGEGHSQTWAKTPASKSSPSPPVHISAGCPRRKGEHHSQSTCAESPAGKSSLSPSQGSVDISVGSYKREGEGHSQTWAKTPAGKSSTSPPVHVSAGCPQTTQLGEKLSLRWVDWFLTRHQDHLGQQWACPHDCIRSATATPEVIAGYFAAYKSIFSENGEKLPAHWQFAMDETGVLLGSDQRKRCIVGQKQVQAARNSSGHRDLITYVPIISGAGKLVENLVIFPGKKMMKNWVAKNPKKFGSVVLLQFLMH